MQADGRRGGQEQGGRAALLGASQQGASAWQAHAHASAHILPLPLPYLILLAHAHQRRVQPREQAVRGAVGSHGLRSVAGEGGVQDRQEGWEQRGMPSRRYEPAAPVQAGRQRPPSTPALAHLVALVLRGKGVPKRDPGGRKRAVERGGLCIQRGVEERGAGGSGAVQRCTASQMVLQPRRYLKPRECVQEPAPCAGRAQPTQPPPLPPAPPAHLSEVAARRLVLLGRHVVAAHRKPGHRAVWVLLHQPAQRRSRARQERVGLLP